jgi:hypothetical protein
MISLQQFGEGFEESKKVFDYYVEKGGNFVGTLVHTRSHNSRIRADNNDNLLGCTDTANIYTEGTSERYLGELVAPIRSQMVVATKYSINPPSFFSIPVRRLLVISALVGVQLLCCLIVHFSCVTSPQASLNAKNANYGGNHRKAMVQGLDESLKRMKLDYVDILYVHAWDARTPVEETMRYTDGHSLASTADLMR